MKKAIIKPELVESNIKYENKYMKVREDKVIFKRYNENDKLEKYEKAYYVVDSGDFVVVIIMDGDKLLLVNQYRYPIKSFCNEFVAGYIEKGQSPEDAAKMEAKEEGGIVAKDVNVIGQIYPLVGKHSQCAHICLIDDFEESEAELEDFEKFANLTSKWVSIKEFKEMVLSGKIKDGVTLSAWALLQSHLK